MKIALFSDLHVDHYKDGVRRFCDDLVDHPPPEADVAVLAGDIADGRFPDQYRSLFRALRDHYNHVVMVTGNHDYYKADKDRAHRSLALAIEGLDNVHHLHRSSVDIDGRRFHGHTMWYRDHLDNERWQYAMNDIVFIPSLNDWVYDENYDWEAYFRGHVRPGDVVVTHHLPSMRSVAKQYKTSPTNRFFVCDMEQLIQKQRPSLWLHGHTHEPCDYTIDITRVVCNPKGYPRERTFPSGRYEPLIVEV